MFAKYPDSTRSFFVRVTATFTNEMQGSNHLNFTIPCVSNLFLSGTADTFTLFGRGKTIHSPETRSMQFACTSIADLLLACSTQINAAKSTPVTVRKFNFCLTSALVDLCHIYLITRHLSEQRVCPLVCGEFPCVACVANFPLRPLESQCVKNW